MDETQDPTGIVIQTMRKLLDEARKRLVETGARNKLIHAARDAARAKSINLSGALSDRTFHVLVRDEKSFEFAPVPEDEEAIKGAAGGSTAVAFPMSTAAGSKTSKNWQTEKLQTRLIAAALQKRLLGMYRDSKTLEEEQGVNILYLAVGFLRWFENESSETPREAPLILIPVNLVRNNARSLFRLEARDDEISTNLPLQERMRQFGISLPEIPETEDWNPATYFDAVRDAVAIQPRWSIDDNGMMLGFFSFSKLMMFRDLIPENWSANSLLDHAFLRGILLDGFPYEEPLFPDDVLLDDIFDPKSLIHIVDADSSQALVIETVRKQRSLVVQGPPGTGKSQTIANIIAAAVHDGKSVLFIAEKMAALKVVHDRLAKAGLRDICIELHSRQ
jgi:hypothetical protein